MGKWRIVHKGVKGNSLLEANTYNLNQDIRKATTLSVWLDWEGYYNTYYSKYPFMHDIKLYRGKDKNKALEIAKKYMRNH